MLNYLAINNIRLFKDCSSNFTLPPLSVFCGTNSCGKSTILKTLLLLRQSQGLFETYGTRPGTLRFTGAQVDLGNYPSLVTNNDISKKIEISIGFTDSVPRIYLRELFHSAKLPKKLGANTRHELTFKGSFVFSATRSSSQEDSANEMKSTSVDGVMSSSRWEVVSGEERLISWEIKQYRSSGSTRPRYQIHLPVASIPESRPELRQLIRNPQQETVVIDIELDGLVLTRALRFPRTSTEKRQFTVRDVPDIIPLSMQLFVRCLRQIHYIAPLRAPAKRYYLTNFDLSTDLDPSGEFLPYFLGGVIEEPSVLDVLPKCVSVTRHSLSEALNGWLYYLRTGSMYYKPRQGEFRSSTHKSALVEISLKGTQGVLVHSLADSGFGYSQVLPILVRGLLAVKGSSIVIEQPELHLNPALQVRLADFFISMVHAGKQVIIETHSEHIVNAIRARTGLSRSKQLNEVTKIYFIDIQGGRPRIYDFHIRPDGTIPEWPRNFFGEALYLATELLRGQRRIYNPDSQE